MANTIPHPFDNLAAQEINSASKLLRQCFPEGSKFDFRSISLYEPEKSEMKTFLTAELAGIDLQNVKRPTRQARVVYYLGEEVCLFI